MKKLLLILLCVPLIGFGQTAEEYFNKAYDYAENGQYQLTSSQPQFNVLGLEITSQNIQSNQAVLGQVVISKNNISDFKI